MVYAIDRRRQKAEMKMEFEGIVEKMLIKTVVTFRHRISRMS